MTVLEYLVKIPHIKFLKTMLNANVPCEVYCRYHSTWISFLNQTTRHNYTAFTVLLLGRYAGLWNLGSSHRTMYRNNRPTFVLWRQSSKYFENCAHLGYYAASNGNFLPTFQDNLLVPSFFFFYLFLNTDDGADRLSRNIVKNSPLLAA